MRYMTAKFPILILTTLALSTLLSACNKSKTETTTATSTTATTSTTTTTEIVEVGSTPEMTALATSATEPTLIASSVAVTSAPALTVASSTAMTDLQMANVGDPKTSVKNVMEGLRTGRVTYAMGFIQSEDKNLKKVLVDSLPMYKDIKSIKYLEPQYSDDKTRAIVTIIITTKSSKTPVQVPYGVQKTMTGWKVLAQTTTSNVPTTPNSQTPIVIQNGKEKSPQLPQNGKPIKQRTDDVVKTKTKAGTPEDTLKQAMNAMIKAPTSEAMTYYAVVVSTNDTSTDKTNSDKTTKDTTTKSKASKTKGAKTPVTPDPMTILAEKVATQQALFQQTLQSVQIGKTQYNKDKTEAVVSAVFTPYAKTGSKPQDLKIKMQKVNGDWKIVSE